MVSLARLSCFVAVAEELHFGRAAERLHMTQPPLSRQIQQLESELGVQLIERSTRAVTLTPTGAAFLPDARRILQLAEGAAQTVKRIPAGDLGTVVIGFTAASAHVVLPRLLGAAREKLPDVKLDLREMVTAVQLEGLMTGEVDLGMARPPVRRRGAAVRADRDAGAHDAGARPFRHRYRAGACVSGDAASRGCGVPLDRGVP